MSEVASDQRAEREILQEVVPVDEGPPEEVGQREDDEGGDQQDHQPRMGTNPDAGACEAARSRGEGGGFDRRRSDRSGHAGDGAGCTPLRFSARIAGSRRSSSAHQPTMSAKSTVRATTDV